MVQYLSPVLTNLARDVEHWLERVCSFEGPFSGYVPYINKRKVVAILHIDLGQNQSLFGSTPTISTSSQV
jgi:hypothetical protein